MGYWVVLGGGGVTLEGVVTGQEDTSASSKGGSRRCAPLSSFQICEQLSKSFKSQRVMIKTSLHLSLDLEESHVSAGTALRFSCGASLSPHGVARPQSLHGG